MEKSNSMFENLQFHFWKFPSPFLEISNSIFENFLFHFCGPKTLLFPGMKEAIQFYVDREVHLFLGPCCDYAAAPIGRQIKYWDLPMITPGAMARDFAEMKASMFRLMTRVGPSVNSLVLVLKAVLYEYQWSKIKVIYNPIGQDYVTIRYCHIVADGLHYGMPGKPQYAKFEKEEEILTRMETDIGRENGGKFFKCMTCRKSVVWIIIWWKGVECSRRSIHGYDVTMWAVSFKIDVFCLCVYILIKIWCKNSWFLQSTRFLVFFLKKRLFFVKVILTALTKNKIFPKCK